jgi:hypothetical protein
MFVQVVSSMQQDASRAGNGLSTSEKKFHAFYGTPKLLTLFTQTRHLIACHMNLFHAIPFSCFNIPFYDPISVT